jgi:hypothetical protein
LCSALNHFLTKTEAKPVPNFKITMARIYFPTRTQPPQSPFQLTQISNPFQSSANHLHIITAISIAPFSPFT